MVAHITKPNKQPKERKPKSPFFTWYPEWTIAKKNGYYWQLRMYPSMDGTYKTWVQISKDVYLAVYRKYITGKKVSHE